MNYWKSFGVVAGMIIGVIVVIILFRLSNTNKKIGTEYDERQNAIRGKGYKTAFYAMLVYEVIIIVLSCGGLSLPVEPFILHFGTVFVGCTVLGCYFIWNDAYWGLNNNRRRYYLIFAGLFLINLASVIRGITAGGMFENGMLSAPFVSLLILVMMICLGITMLARHYQDNNAEEK